jgi:RNA polymerase sigma-70 factor (ECF subfamily)
MAATLPVSEESKWIEGCRKGDRSAQHAVFEKYKRRMYALCYRYCGSSAEAEDAMMQGFMKVFTKIDQYESKGSFEGWVKRIMIFESLQSVRKQKQLFVHMEAADNDGHNLEPAIMPEGLEMEDYMQMINALPLGYKTIFNLYAIEGYSHQEIAELLGISVNTSKSQLSRARALLQAKLEQINIQNKNRFNI